MTQLKSLLASPLTIPLAALVSFMSGPFSEEFGWRGYALEPLIRRFGMFPGTLLLGFTWAVWHLPLYFMADGWHAQMGFELTGFWTFIIFNIALSLIMTWVYLNTNRSILSAMLLHFAVNFSAQLISPYSERVELLRVIPMLVIGIIGCTATPRKHAHKLS
jgi:membrane protease YdiL (CAAX protease family)